MTDSAEREVSAALHRHLSTCFKRQVCCDIRFKAFNRMYSLHRIFLVQSTFFNSLFNGDFQEAKAKRGVWRPSNDSNKRESGEEDDDDDNDAVELHFDDPNITRPAFEYCIATLYAAEPVLTLPGWCSPTPTYPLTPHFGREFASRPPASSPAFVSTSSLKEGIGQAQHPATPRFLLSLIATATYLGIPSVSAQAVTLILCSITPYTVSHYLRFSLGLGIVGAAEAKARQEAEHSHWDWELEGPAWGLDISKKCRASRAYLSPLVQQMEGVSMEEDDDGLDEEAKAGSEVSHTSYTASSKGAKESNGDSFLPSFISDRDVSMNHQGQFYYGVQSDKIGEACASWLLRWGSEVLLVEEATSSSDANHDLQSYVSAFTLPPDTLPIACAAMSAEVDAILSLDPPPRPAVWCHAKIGGIPAAWARIIIASDSLWIKSEWDRYDLARRMVTMRRGYLETFVEADESFGSEDLDEAVGNMSSGDSLHRKDRSGSMSSPSSPKRATHKQTRSNEDSLYGDDEDEVEYAALFAEGIYYTHMSFAELSAISNQLCPHTGSTYVPLNVLQSALWAQSELKGMILGKERQKTLPAKRVEEDEAEDPLQRESSSDNATDGERELGLVSEEAEFALACQNTQKKPRHSRGSTPSSSFHAQSSETATILGGLRPLMLLGASSKSRAIENLLEKRFYAVPSDDTIRVGENLSSLISGLQGGAGDIPPPMGGVGRGGGNLFSNVKVDSTGGPTGVASMVDNRTLSISHESRKVTSKEYFGIQNAVKTGRQLGQTGHQRVMASPSAGPKPQDWTGYEPMRLGVEFSNIDRLKEKERMYSPSFFYAGSIWNLYVQVIKKPKGLQLGIYLHRQNGGDAAPHASVPSDMMVDDDVPSTTMGEGGNPQTPRRRDGSTAANPPPTTGAAPGGGIFYTSSPAASHTGIADGGGGGGGTSTPVQRPRNQPLHNSTSTTPHQSQTQTHLQASSNNGRASSTYSLTPSPSQTQVNNNNNSSSSSSSGTSSSSSPALHGTGPPYLDPRRILRAYFSVHCPSPLGTSLTKFSSRPDDFSLSQSWGWKSSSLLGAVYLSRHQIGSVETQVSPIFRCIVTVGVV